VLRPAPITFGLLDFTIGTAALGSGDVAGGDGGRMPKIDGLPRDGRGRDAITATTRAAGNMERTAGSITNRLMPIARGTR
jgi:hypothetical protein